MEYVGSIPTPFLAPESSFLLMKTLGYSGDCSSDLLPAANMRPGLSSGLQLQPGAVLPIEGPSGVKQQVKPLSLSNKLITLKYEILG